MSEKLRESLSAIVDDEADEFELRRVLDEVNKNPELKAAWERYHLMGAVMREEVRTVDGNLRERVWSALEIDATGEAGVVRSEIDEAGEAPPVATRKLGRTTGFAVAATVAAAFVFGGLQLLDNPDAPAPVIAGTTAAAPFTAPADALLNVEATASDEERTAAYMLYHTQHLGMNQVGVAAFTRMVTYQRR